MSLSNTYETLALQWLFTADVITRPTAWYLGLFTTDPTDAGSGTEVSGSGYAREAATFSATGDTATNTAAIEFSVATGSWGTISHVGVFDALSGGNLIAHGALDTPRTIALDEVFRVPVGDLDLTLN